MREPSVRVRSLTNQAVIADKCVVAERFLQRLRGLIGMKSLEPGRGMLFPRCNDIHMWFMRIPIDVVFLEIVGPAGGGAARYRVTSIHRRVRPWRLLPLWDGRASETLELPAGTIDRCSIAVGDELACTS